MSVPDSCSVNGCDSTALSLIDDNGETDPRRDRFEIYECENGHQQTLLLEAEAHV